MTREVLAEYDALCAEAKLVEALVANVRQHSLGASNEYRVRWLLWLPPDEWKRIALSARVEPASVTPEVRFQVVRAFSAKVAA